MALAASGTVSSLRCDPYFVATLQTAIAWTLAIALVGGLLVLLIRAGRFLLTRWKSCSRSRVALEAFGVAVLAIVWVGMSQNVP